MGQRFTIRFFVVLLFFQLFFNVQVALPVEEDIPIIKDFSPKQGYVGSIVDISGENLTIKGRQTEVTINEKPTLIIYSSPTLIRFIISDPNTTSGLIKIKVGEKSVYSPNNFTLLKNDGGKEKIDGPPLLLGGKSLGAPVNILSKGKLKLLVVLVHPTDHVPSDELEARALVEKEWEEAKEFYRQASYQRLNLDVIFTSSYHQLSGTYNDYIAIDEPPCGGDAGDVFIMEESPGDTGNANVRCEALERLMAEGAQAAIDEKIDLNQFDAMAVSININGIENMIRGLGGWSQQQFTYGNIDIQLAHELHLIALGGNSDSMRIGHEIGHMLVSLPPGLNATPGTAVLSEDIYAGDGVSNSEATAEKFDLMGAHDYGPLFSGYNMDKLGYYDSSNVRELKYADIDGQEYELVSHGPGPEAGIYPWHYNNASPGPGENTNLKRFHLLKIRVTEDLYYYVEVRHRPERTGLYQLFDKDLPYYDKVSSPLLPFFIPEPGGVVVTKVLTGQVVTEQNRRFITLSHPSSRSGPRVLKKGEAALGDYNLKITVLEDRVETDPQVCRVKVELDRSLIPAEPVFFDLRVEPQDGSWQSPSIWVDVPPYTYPVAGQRPPIGERPKVGEPNRIWTRVYADGNRDVNNVQVRFYINSPHGTGNTNGELIGTKTISLRANTYKDTWIEWTPENTLPTAIKVVVVPQDGEMITANNSTRENLFQVEAVASSSSSIPEVVMLPVVIRNPIPLGVLPSTSLNPIYIHVKDVPKGFMVQVPHSLIWLAPQQERRFNITVIPTGTYSSYKEGSVRNGNIRLVWSMPLLYSDEMLLPAMGGITAQVTPKQQVRLTLSGDPANSNDTTIALTGSLTPALAGETVRVDLIDPKGKRRVKDVTTNAYGRFQVRFDLTQAPSLDANPTPEPNDGPYNGVYQAQAFVINSPNAAQATSNVVTINK
jgi:hypothetical protein